MKRFDYLVLGGGSGGVASARRAAQHGKRVALTESGRLGGTCVNVGCVPKKIMWSAAGIAEMLEDARDYGFDVSGGTLSFARLKQGRDAYVHFLNGVYAKNLATEGVEHVEGYGRFVDAHTIEVGERKLTAEHVLIATGGRPRAPAIAGAEHGITSDRFFDLTARPDRVAIVGGGYVAAELGGVLRALGAEVTMLLHHGEPLRGFDPMLRTTLVEHMEASGIVIRPWLDITRLERAGAELTLEARSGDRIGPFDCVLWAIGRAPHTPGIGLGRLGAALDGDGHAVGGALPSTSVAG